mgnify:CR=1 FL=1
MYHNDTFFNEGLYRFVIRIKAVITVSYMRRKHWLDYELAAAAAYSDALQQGAHVAFKNGRFKVHRGSQGSAVGELLTYKCRLNDMVYCGFYNRHSLLSHILDDFKYITKSYNEEMLAISTKLQQRAKK